jgi:hypothetical protein
MICVSLPAFDVPLPFSLMLGRGRMYSKVFARSHPITVPLEKERTLSAEGHPLIIIHFTGTGAGILNYWYRYTLKFEIKCLK